MSRLLAIMGIALALPSVVRADPQALAKRIDALLTQEHQVHKIQVAPPAADAEFLRRAYLDLTGRIPQVSDVRAFLADQAPDKRARLIAALLDDPRHALHFANLWRALLIPETAASAQARTFQPGFEAWLRQRFRANVAYDRMVRELLTVPIATDGQAAESVFRDFEKPNALAFFAVKEARPENLAGATTRLFLGVQLECAQCHDHPFAKWSRKQFWNQAAFFAGIERQGKTVFAPLVEVVDRRDVTLPSGVSKTTALLLDGTKPNFLAGTSSRVALADWVTAADNPYFARATVNRVWSQLFGVGLVDPVDNFHDENKPSHPELLDELARKFAEAKFDLNYLLSAICLTDAYQRSSAHAPQPGRSSPVRPHERQGLDRRTILRQPGPGDPVPRSRARQGQRERQGSGRGFAARFVPDPVRAERSTESAGNVNPASVDADERQVRDRRDQSAQQRHAPRGGGYAVAADG
jgi:hypothetical protein